MHSVVSPDSTWLWCRVVFPCDCESYRYAVHRLCAVTSRASPHVCSYLRDDGERGRSEEPIRSPRQSKQSERPHAPQLLRLVQFVVPFDSRSLPLCFLGVKRLKSMKRRSLTCTHMSKFIFTAQNYKTHDVKAFVPRLEWEKNKQFRHRRQNDAQPSLS